MNLDSQDGAVACVLLGAALLAAPWYLDRAVAAGVGYLVDPLSALGLLPAGVFPVAVGAGYLVAGLLSLTFVGSEPLAYRPVVVAGLAAVAGTVVAGIGFLYRRTGSLTAPPEAAALVGATAAVPVAFVAGLDADAPGRRWPFALLLALFVPPLVLLGVRADGSVGSAIGGSLATGLGVLLVCAVVLGYPLYRLARSFEVVVR